jgi:glucose/arabinose dehydrogenase
MPRPLDLLSVFLLFPLAAISQAQTTGSITRHLWTGINGTAVSDLTSRPTFPNSPNTSGTLTSFLAPTNWSDNYGTRVFGWVRAPVTGNYTFSMHADDNAELWLSTTISPDSRRLIASIPEWTDVNEWTKFASQNSASIPLIAGRFYYIEALQKEGTGGDNLGVAWSYPGQSRTIIPGSALAPWVNLAPVTNNDQAVVAPGGLVGIPVLANDLDPNGRANLNLSTLAVITPPIHGTTTVDNISGQIRYQHNGSAASTDSFVYRIRDAAGLTSTATVSLTVSAAARLAVATSQMPPGPPELTISLPNAFPGLSFIDPVGIAAPPGESNRVFVIEKGGVIQLIPNLTSPAKVTFLNLASLVNGRTAAPAEVFQTSSEQGLLGLAFHPNYAQNRRFFVVYSVTVGGTRVQRLSEFLASSSNPNTAFTGSERVFIQQVNDASNHNGGDIHFGPDGYLYMAWGDEGGSNDQYNTAQKINGDFWSSITRIDVDLEAQDYTVSDGTGGDDANLRPNFHTGIVLDANGNPRYEIPADNPWIGATQFLGSPVNPAQVRTEFWAVGLRNPWRMSFDPVTGTLWCADVGQGAREEVNKIVRGGNYEWAFREGFTTGAKWNSRPSGWTGSHPPIYD